MSAFAFSLRRVSTCALWRWPRAAISSAMLRTSNRAEIGLGSATKVPTPWTRISRPSSVSSRRARLMVMRLTPEVAHQLRFRGDAVTRLPLAGIDALGDHALDARIAGQKFDIQRIHVRSCLDRLMPDMICNHKGSSPFNTAKKPYADEGPPRAACLARRWLAVRCPHRHRHRWHDQVGVARRGPAATMSASRGRCCPACRTSIRTRSSARWRASPKRRSIPRTVSGPGAN